MTDAFEGWPVIVVTETIVVTRVHVVRAGDVADAVGVVQAMRSKVDSPFRKRAREHVVETARGVARTTWNGVEVKR